MVTKQIVIAEINYSSNGFTGYYSIYKDGKECSSGTFDSFEELGFLGIKPTVMIISGKTVFIKKVNANNKEEAIQKIGHLVKEIKNYEINWKKVEYSGGFISIIETAILQSVFEELKQIRAVPSYFVIDPFSLDGESGSIYSYAWEVTFKENCLDTVKHKAPRSVGSDPLHKNLAEKVKETGFKKLTVQTTFHEQFLEERKRVRYAFISMTVFLGMIYLLSSITSSLQQNFNVQNGLSRSKTESLSLQIDSLNAAIKQKKDELRDAGILRPINSAFKLDRIISFLKGDILFNSIRYNSANGEHELLIEGRSSSPERFNEWTGLIKEALRGSRVSIQELKVNDNSQEFKLQICQL